MTIQRDAFESAPQLLRYIGNNILQFEALQDSGVDIDNLGINQKGIFGDTPLIVVARQQTSDAVALTETRLLIDAGADANLKGELGDTALHTAARVGRRAIIAALLDAGAQSDIQNQDGKTAFDIAKDSGFVAIAGYLASR